MTERAPSRHRTRTIRVVLCALLLAVGAAACAGDTSGPVTQGAQTADTKTPTAESSTTTALPPAPPSTSPPSATTTEPVAPVSSDPEPAHETGPDLPDGHDTTVTRVTDGDTLVVGGSIRVRLIGMDTPETQDPRTAVQCFGPAASRRTGELLPAGTPVRLVYDVDRTDRYGRTLAYVYRLSDGLFVNLALVRDGFATVATYPPNVAHVEDFRSAEREAREAGRGLWGGCPASGPTPTTTTAAPGPAPVTDGGGGACDPSYPDVCIPPAPPDLDCPQVSFRNFRVVGADPHRFDGNHDGVGCES